MKKTTKLLIIIFIFILTNINIFAESGFEAILNVPIGLSISIPTGSYRESFLDKNADRSGNIVADAGVSAQIGYLFDIDKYDDIGVSLLAEIGYQYNVYSYMSHLNKHYDNGFSIDDKLNYYLKAHNFQLGLLPKFVKGNFAFGVGFGVKFPLSLIISTENIIIDFNNREYHREQVNENYNIQDVGKLYESIVIPYVKLTFDYSIFFTEKIALNLGAYVNYDYGLKSKYADLRIDSVDIAVQIGLRFAPQL